MRGSIPTACGASWTSSPTTSWRDCRPPRTRLATGRVFGEVLGRVHRFAGNEVNYYDPDNSFIHRVLERRVGIPITLSAIYLFVARRLSVPMYGIGMPGHFLVQCGDERRGRVFLDPFRRGEIMTRADCGGMLKAQGLDDSEDLLPVLPDRNTLARMIANLLNIYRRDKDLARAGRYERLFLRTRGEVESL